MINTAIILAAGMGKRFNGSLGDKPKGFIEIDDDFIVESSIKKLINCGINTIYIGTGYSDNYYNDLAKKYPSVRCIYNNKYQETGSMYTLFNMRKKINKGFLLLESDLLYDKFGLSQLLQEKNRDVILASGFTNSGDEVFIEADEYFNLINLSKDKSVLSSVYGELVGITKISNFLFNKMCYYFEKSDSYGMNYEDCLCGISYENKIFVLKNDDYIWCEIDNIEHLKRACEFIYPKIKKNEK